MSDSHNGCFGIIIILIYAISWIGTGVMAWNWIEPDSFGGAILFIMAWSFLGFIAHMIGGIIVVGLQNIIK